MNFSRHENTSNGSAKESLARYFGTPLLIAAFAFVFAALLHGAAGSDRSGEGMVVLGLSIFAAPMIAVGGALSFIFRRTIVGEFFGGACLFATIFFGTLFITG